MPALIAPVVSLRLHHTIGFSLQVQWGFICCRALYLVSSTINLKQ